MAINGSHSRPDRARESRDHFSGPRHRQAPEPREPIDLDGYGRPPTSQDRFPTNAGRAAPRPAAYPPRGRIPVTAGERNPWHWLLLVPIVLPLITALYNRLDPRLFGIPFFYWFQLTFVGLEIAIVTLVYQATKRRNRS
jgi:hypothetical protein